MLPNNNNNSSSNSSSSSSSSNSSSIIGSKRPAETQLTSKIVEEEDCAICLAPLGTEGVKTLDKVVINGKEVCGHSFHKECIDQWINSTRQQEGGPKCPECRTPISAAQQPPPPIQAQRQTIVQAAQRDLPRVRAQEIQNEEQQLGEPIPFMGILVCLNGQPFQTKYLNSSPEIVLRTNNTLGDLKDKILALAPKFAQERTFFCQTNMGRYVNNALSATGLTTYREPSFRIKNMYFGTPFSCDNIWQLNIGVENILNNDSLIDIYKAYQDNINFASESLNNRILYDIYDRHIVTWRATGPEDPGYRHTDYFVNFNNPPIPQRFQARPRIEGELSDFQRAHSTRHSLAWLVVNIECNTLTRPINTNTNTTTLEQNQRPGGGRQVPLAGGKMKGKTRNKHYRHKKSVRRNKKTIRRRMKKTVRK